jgi:hypothetical protein
MAVSGAGRPAATLEKPFSPNKLAPPSNGCSWQKPSVLSIGDRRTLALSGLAVSFGKTLQYLPHKTVTRRAWKDSHAKKFINAFHKNKLVKALDKDIRWGGKQIGWCRLKSAPYKEKLCDMPPSDLKAEGAMCRSVGEFVGRYFKGNSNLEVWVIRFEFIADLEAYTNSPSLRKASPAVGGQANSNSSLVSPIESIYQAERTGLGVYPASENRTNTNYPILSPVESIHQAEVALLGVCPASENQANTNHPILSQIKSIHQTLLGILGICPEPDNQTNINHPIHSPQASIHQVSFRLISVYQLPENQTNANFPIHSPQASIHQALLAPFGVCQLPQNLANTNYPIHSPTESIHQTPPATLT